MDKIEKSVYNDVEKKEVDWQDNCPDITSRIKKILETKLGTDCEFLVGQEQNQKSFSGHKIILAMTSPTFEKHFYGDFAKEEVIKVPDVNPNVFQMMIDFIYTDEVQIQNVDDSIDLFYVARKYWIKTLAKRCADFMLQNMNSTNVCKIYEYACFFEESDLKNFCLQFISAKTNTILIDENFLEIKLSTLSTIFSLDRLNIKSEVNLWQALNRYAIANGYITPLNKNDDPELGNPCKDDKDSENDIVRNDNKSITNNQENLLKCEQDQNSLQNAATPTEVENISSKNITDLRPAIKNIRFLTLTSEEFSKLLTILPKILSDSDALSLLIRICNKQCFWPLPKGFSGSRIKRKTPIRTQEIKKKRVLCIHGYSRIESCHECRIYNEEIVESDGVKVFNSNFYGKNNSLKIPNKIKHIKMTKKQILDFEMSFIVDKQIYLKGVVIPTQTLDSLDPNVKYIECLGIYLLDDLDCCTGHSNFAKLVPYNSFAEILFPQKMFIDKNRIYKIGISFNVLGCYPMYSCCTEILNENVHFLFFTKLSGNILRAGLISKILFDVA